MTYAQFKALQKTAEWIRGLPPERFNFREVVRHGNPEKQQDGQYCGTVACVIGWTPAIFPDTVEWNGKDCRDIDGPKALTIKGEPCDYLEVGAFLYGLTRGCAGDLFMPQREPGDEEERFHPVHKDLPLLGDNASPREVADLLDTFLDLVRRKQIDKVRLRGKYPFR